MKARKARWPDQYGHTGKKQFTITLTKRMARKEYEHGGKYSQVAKDFESPRRLPR
jgi:hypothetical protein